MLTGDSSKQNGVAISKSAGFALFMIGLVGFLGFGGFLLHNAQMAEQAEKSGFLAVLNEDSASIQTLMATRFQDNVTYNDLENACGNDLSSRMKREENLRLMDAKDLGEAKGRLIALFEAEQSLVRAVRMSDRNELKLNNLGDEEKYRPYSNYDILGAYAERDRQIEAQKSETRSDIESARTAVLSDLTTVQSAEQDLQSALHRVGLGFAPSSKLYSDNLRADMNR